MDELFGTFFGNTPVSQQLAYLQAALLENNPTMKPETAAKRAREAAAKYAAKQHRQRAYTIATTELASYNKICRQF